MKNKIIEVIHNACALEEKVTEESILEMLSLDSLTFVSIIVALENEFEIEFDIEKLNINNWETVQDIIEIVEEMCSEKE